MNLAHALHYRLVSNVAMTKRNGVCVMPKNLKAVKKLECLCDDSFTCSSCQDLQAKAYKAGVDESPYIKIMLEAVIDKAFELVQDEREAYPYDLESAKSELEYRSRDGFWANDFNKGGYRIRMFETVDLISGSGTYPASAKASKAIEESEELNHKLALEQLGIKPEEYAELDEAQLEKVWELRSEMGQDDTIMFEVVVMYHGKERGIHKASVQVVINYEHQYHRSSSSNEDCVETEVTWKCNSAGTRKMLKAIKAGIKKLY